MVTECLAARRLLFFWRMKLFPPACRLLSCKVLDRRFREQRREGMGIAMVKRGSTYLRLFLAVGILLAGCTADKPSESGAPASPSESTASGEARSPSSEATDSVAAELPVPEFSVSRNADGSATAVPVGLEDYWLESGPALELQGSLYHLVTLSSYSDGQVTSALLSFRPDESGVQVLWSETVGDSDNPRYSSFHSNNIRKLAKLDESHVLFLEPEIVGEGGRYHLSELDIATGKIQRLREDFWPLTEEHDYIYQFRWNDSQKKLFMQSYLGYLWMFDLSDGKDHASTQKFRVIPHSTSGYPSLFPSPGFDRFVFDDESGSMTFHRLDGTPLQSIKLTGERYIPSEKIKWNPEGTVAWMESAPTEKGRIKDVDIDYMIIAPQRLDFFDSDGNPLGALEADGGDGRALEIVRWLDASTAVVKTYTAIPFENDPYMLEERDAAYYLYDVLAKKKSSAEGLVAAENAGNGDGEGLSSAEKLRVVVEDRKLVYRPS